MKYQYHVIVIGAGSAGLVVASGAANLGARVALIERDRMGGDCLNTGCVPSKTFLRSAHLSKDMQLASRYGLDVSPGAVDLARVMSRVKAVIEEIAPHDSVERFEGLGVDVFKGAATVVDGHTVAFNGRQATARHIVIATGSEPLIPAIPGLEGVAYRTNQTIFDLQTLPRHLLVIGGGPIGLELGQGFLHLGSQVTVVDRNGHLFPKDEPEVGPLMESVFREEGMRLMLKSEVMGVQQTGERITLTIRTDGQVMEVSGDQLLVSSGRKPATADLGLEGAGVKTDEKGYVITDKRLRTTVPSIYACGDVVGPFQFTHMAGHQAGVVLRNILFHLRASPTQSLVPWTTYTKPEVAHIGYTEQWSRGLGLYGGSLIRKIADNDRAKAEDDRNGFVKLILGKKGHIIGATLVGQTAGEMIPLVSLAIRQKLKPAAFTSFIFSYPTKAELFQATAYDQIKSHFKPWQKQLIQKVFLG
jgi:pyruvate/2-oxoglutarate dehydrogenase complex dihydrolipoamide dehydrogenase (E3) component